MADQQSDADQGELGMAAGTSDRVQRARDLASQAFKNARTDIKPVNKDIAEKIIAAAKQAQAAGLPLIGGSKTAEKVAQSGTTDMAARSPATQTQTQDEDMPKMLSALVDKQIGNANTAAKSANTQKADVKHGSEKHKKAIKRSVVGSSNPFKPKPFGLKPSPVSADLRALPSEFMSRNPAPPPRRIRVVLPLLIGVALAALGLKVTNMSSVISSQEAMTALFGDVAIAQQAEDSQSDEGTEDADNNQSKKVPAVQVPTSAELNEQMSALPADRLEELRRQLESLEDDDETVGLFTDVPEKFQERVSERLREIDNRERLLLERQILLETVEVRIEQKIEELTAVRDDIQGRIDQMREEAAVRHSDKILRLVKVYQSMKPKQAAAVFNSLDINVLVPVAEKMKETNLSAVIAVMDNQRAVELTGRLAENEAKKIEQLSDAAAEAGTQSGGEG